MRVVHIITGLGRGGAERTLAKVVAHTNPSIEQFVIVLSAKNVELLPFVTRGSNAQVLIFNFDTPLLIISEFFRLKKVIQELNPTIVQSWLYHADFISLLLAIFGVSSRLILNIRHSNFTLGSIRFRTWLLVHVNIFLTIIVRPSIIFSSYRARETHMDRGMRARQDFVLSNGFLFDSIKSRRYENTDASTFLIASVARFDKQKDHKNLIEALGIFRDLTGASFKCFLAGAHIDEKNEQIAQWVESNNVRSNICLLGSLDDPLNELMNKVDILISSSLGESFPNVIVESMGVGTPCVATNVGDTARIIGPLGWLCDAQCPNQLGKRLASAYYFWLMDHDRFVALGEECARWVRDRYGIDKMVVEQERIWRLAAA